MSKAYDKIIEDIGGEPQFLIDLRERINTLDDIETELIQRYTFSEDGAILCKEQLFILECMDAIKRITKKP